MADYEFRYEMTRAPLARSDGSGHVTHDIRGVCRLAGSVDPWSYRPGLPHKTISVPAADLLTALSSGTNNQKINAYKDLLVENVYTIPEPLQGWNLAIWEQILDQNDTSAAAAQAADEFIRDSLGVNYPVRFTI